jgi:hypothetical protein
MHLPMFRNFCKGCKSINKKECNVKVLGLELEGGCK